MVDEVTIYPALSHSVHNTFSLNNCILLILIYMQHDITHALFILSSLFILLIMNVCQTTTVQCHEILGSLENTHAINLGTNSSLHPHTASFRSNHIIHFAFIPLPHCSIYTEVWYTGIMHVEQQKKLLFPFPEVELFLYPADTQLHSVAKRFEHSKQY